MCTSIPGDDNDKHSKTAFISKVISLIVALSNVIGVIPLYVTFTHHIGVDFTLTLCAMLFSFLHHITATNRKLIPYVLASKNTESTLLWLDRIFALSLVLRGIGYLNYIYTNFHDDEMNQMMMFIIYIIGVALVCLFVSDVLIKEAYTNKMRIIYGILHSIWHMLAFFAWGCILAVAIKEHNTRLIRIANLISSYY